MKKNIIALALALCSCLNAFSQATSLTVDCQTPGWLASYINPIDVPTLRNLTVLGQINSTDLSTIGNLVKDYNLQGRLDLSDVTIVGNKLTGDMFGVTGCKLEYLALPKSIGEMNKCIEWVEVDTLICGCDGQTDFLLGYFTNLSYTPGEYCSGIDQFKVKHLVLRDGLTLFSVSYYNENNKIVKNETLESIQFPKSMRDLNCFENLQCLSDINIPEGVETLGSRETTNMHVYCDTLYVPSSVKRFCDTWAGRDYRNADYGYPHTDRNTNGRIKCLYLPENLETFRVDALHYGAKVDIHIKSKTPPIIQNGFFNSNTIVYVPSGYKSVYKSTGGVNGNSQWGGATILEEIYAERIEISSPEIIYVGDSQLLKAKITPSNTTFKDIMWEVSDKEALSITQDGMCTALRFGTVLVTALNADHSCIDTKTIQIYNHTNGVNISKNALKIKKGDKVTLTANTLPSGTSDGRIKWYTDNESIATVDENGSIRGVGHGTCTITATSIDGGYSATCEVTVTQPVEALTLEKHSLSMKVSDTEKIYAQIAPATADDKTITWTSSDETVVSVDVNGNITALKGGEAWVKAISLDNAEAKDSCKVTVTQPVKGIMLNHNSYELSGIGSSFNLEATVSPDDASNKNIKWKSSNEDICIVSNGLVVAVGLGTCVIIANTEDGGYMATCTVSVTTSTGISSLENYNGSMFEIYDISGTRRNYLQHGINIIRFADGTRKKVQIK